ncbi:uncharacterized protein BJX67DRAFT_350699 [Aspergillus lucknowensis]|uniref:Uncharacterized protein n=1 Tax=Aspergillus lucknowensis TaxID=176173 RepID=A0ABR4LV73_9EURO
MKGGPFKSFPWDTIYETKRVWPKAGSRMGKMEDETVGPKLCWGEEGRGNEATRSLYVVGGLDLQFREYPLALQLARPAVHLLAAKRPNWVEVVSAGVGILTLAEFVP